MQKSKLKFIFFVSVFYFVFSITAAFAQLYNDSPQLGASLYIAPLSENPKASGNFTVTIKTDSLAQPVNAVRGILTFNKDKLEIIGVSKIGSILNLWVDEPSFSNLNGTLKFQGGVPNPGFIGNGGTVLHIIFKAKSPGITSLVWKDGEVLANDGKGTNILINLQNLDFSVEEAIGSINIIPPPQNQPATNNTLIYLNVTLLVIVLFIILFFLEKAIIKYHDKRYHSGDHHNKDKEQEIDNKIEQKLEKLEEFEERLKNTKKIRDIIPVVLFFIAGFSLFAQAALAQSINLKSVKNSYNVNDSFSVSLSINTDGQAINTISGAVSIPTDKFQIIDVRYGSSIISLWVDKPKIDHNSGTINFTGGVPGGYNGSSGPILSFGLKAKKIGLAVIGLQDVKVLLNDGIGTELKNISLNALNLNITEALPKPKEEPKQEPAKGPEEEVYAPVPDTIPPEDFIPMISRYPTIENNKYFASFFAVDKDTGISYYEVMEKPFLLSLITDKFNEPWVKGDSPFILRGQLWAYKVIVRAYDQAGNYADSTIDKPFKPVVLWIFVIILIIISVIVTRFLSRSGHHKKNDKKVVNDIIRNKNIDD